LNKLRGRVVAVESNGHISLVDIKAEVAAAEGDVFTATVLETPDGAPYMQVGADVALMFKETEVSLAKNLSGLISLRNRFPVTVRSIEQGVILSAVGLDYRGQPLLCIITTRGMVRLELKVGDEVEALVKANEVVLGSWA
jgi:molybdate transport system regulatory protein